MALFRMTVRMSATVIRHDWGLASHSMHAGGPRLPPAGVLAKMMVDKVVYTKRQPNTGQGEQQDMRASCSAAQTEPSSSPQARTAATWLSRGGLAWGEVVLRIPATSAAS